MMDPKFQNILERVTRQRNAAQAEIERLRGIVAEAHAKPYHYMTADGKTITARELEAQRNAAWRALAWSERGDRVIPDKFWDAVRDAWAFVGEELAPGDDEQASKEGK